MTASSIYATLGLSRNPFPPTPDAGSYFFTPRLEEDFAEIVHCIEARKGFVLLTGEVGLGKSTLVRRLLDTLGGKKCHSALILNTFLQDSALLSAIQADFGLAPSDSVEQGLARLTEFLIAGHQAGEINLLVIDDAQNLSVESLELVRLLCNLETGQEKLLQILLVGQPELEETLATPELRQLKSRIIKHARLSGLQKDEVTRYFDFRVNAAGAEGRLSIEPAATDLLHRATQGNLRRIHLVLDRCLYGLASTRASAVTAELVQRAVYDLPALGDEAVAVAKVTSGNHSRKAWVLAGLLAGTTATVTLASWGLVSQSGGRSTPTAVLVDTNRPSETARSTASAESQASQFSPGSVPPAAARATTSGAMPSPRQTCEKQLQAAAAPDEVVHVHRLPDGMADSLKLSPRLCRFSVDKESWIAWLGRNNVRQIEAAEQATRKVQGKLKSMGLLDRREPDDGFFGSKTGEAFARFQLQHGLPPTGKPDELTFLLLEHQDASPR
ncbi:AAA family ATPase [Acidovorax sp. HMWF029]|uniref:ExeA family protein n=1 Tax=Acidovorax sp. HMWF029 TaxID=2056863 RepID=UPI000D3A8115|nr:ExeA family protein [Acidovorax sp. HMWF029]PTT19944.1 AAA family ATPase [Acidovorax sp. HMWF029]